jgi:hypothetical protein
MVNSMDRLRLLREWADLPTEFTRHFDAADWLSVIAATRGKIRKSLKNDTTPFLKTADFFRNKAKAAHTSLQARDAAGHTPVSSFTMSTSACAAGRGGAMDSLQQAASSGAPLPSNDILQKFIADGVDVVLVCNSGATLFSSPVEQPVLYNPVGAPSTRSAPSESTKPVDTAPAGELSADQELRAVENSLVQSAALWACLPRARRKICQRLIWHERPSAALAAALGWWQQLWVHLRSDAGARSRHCAHAFPFCG